MSSEQTLPASKDAEMMVLGCMLSNTDYLNKGADGLDALDFFWSEHKLVFTSLKHFYSHDLSCDVHLCAEHLKQTGNLQAVGGVPYVVALCQYAGTSAYMDEYIQTVKSRSVARQVIEAAQQIQSSAFSDPVDVDVLLDEAQKSFYRISQGSGGDAFLTVQQIINGSASESGKSFIQELQDRQERFLKAESEGLSFSTGINTGFYDLDELIDGFGRSNLIILAARPSMGKTALALNLCENICFNNSRPSAFFSLEMSSGQLVERLICARAEVESTKLKKGFIDAPEFHRVLETSEIVKTKNLLIDDQSGISVSTLRNRARRMKEAFGIEFLVIDYLQLLSGPKSYKGSENRQTEVAEISRTLKTLARELNIPVLCLSQLSRKVEDRMDKRPLMSDLRESGAIEQDADVVMMLHRPEYYNDKDREGIAELNIVKNRHGSTGRIELIFEKKYARFRSAAKLSTLRPDYVD